MTIGDFSTTTVDGSFSLVYLVYNTIENLTTQAAQVACFQNAAAHLEPGGFFVIEVEVPQLRRLPPGDSFRVFSATEDRFGIDEIDVATQRAVSHHLSIVDGKLDRWSMPFRYVWPSELDLMAQLAGMSSRERWGDWNREPFTSESRKHVSVWEKQEPRASELCAVFAEAFENAGERTSTGRSSTVRRRGYGGVIELREREHRLEVESGPASVG